ncbi:TonB-dependent siderophore receptor [uncultured Amaricoccus sp.]|uniref:TonB-dependent siderophore receptor n=1 Tax=uncultured Amaricoccus sp. TaxID=339341 RepID=UPI0026197914|nr:TonB-dependent siderophore receptor [uncultured Amaricoccus sp.]
MGAIEQMGRAAAIILLPSAAMAQDGTTAIQLPTIEVEAIGSSDVGPDIGYVAGNTTTGSKTDTPIDLIPQSVSVVTEQEMVDRDVEELENALGYTAGVTPSIWGTDERFDSFLIRGFDVGPYGIYRDGLAQKVIGFSGFRIEPYGAQRVEVLRGPAGTLYGENNPGGLVNIVTKRPQFETFREAAISYGSFDTLEAKFDLTGPLGDGGTLAYRLTGLFRDGNGQLENSPNDRVYIAPALTWQPDDATSLTILANIQNDEMSPAFNFPVAGMDFPDDVTPPPAWFDNTMPPWSRYHANIAQAGYLFSHEIDENWTIRQNVRYSRQKTDYRDLYFAGMVDATTMAMSAFTVNETAEVFAADNQAQYEFELGASQNTLLLGADYNLSTVDGDMGYDDGLPDSGNNPNLQMPLADPNYDDLVIADPPPFQDGKQTIEQAGLYLQNQSQIGARTHVTLGLRQAFIDNRNEDRLSGVNTSQRDNPFIWNLGVNYALDNGLTPYAGYSTGFVTNIGTNAEGDLYQPSESEQMEIGLKFRPSNFDGFFTAALFNITNSNVLTTDPENPNFSVQTGEVRHRGLELEGNFDLGDGLSGVATYTYIDAEITANNDGYVGNRPSLVPEHQASVWANYAMPEGRFEGLSFGAGLRYVGQTFGDDSNLITVPSYTLADAAIRYARGRLEGSINATNLFDKSYYATCYAGGGCIAGDERVITAMLTARF